MMQSVRSKLVLSHLIPTLLLLPILSLYLLYSLESFYTQSLLQQLENQSRLLRDEVERNTAVISSADAAQSFLATIAPLADSRVILLNREATVLASTRVEDDARIGSFYDHPSVQQALRGDAARGVGPGFTTDVAYVVLPLYEGNQVVGALRLSYEVADVRGQFDQLRWLVLGGTLLTALLALALALGLAMTITRPLQQVSESARRIAGGNYRTRVEVRSRDEVGALAHSFNQMVQRLEEAEQARARQLAAIVHELARPLAGMRAAVETVREIVRDDPVMSESLLDGVEEELGRVERLVGTLQDLQRRALRPIRLNRSRLSLERVIRATVANFEPMAARQGIGLSVAIPRGLAPVDADEDRIIQVLTNLLDNAFKFTPRAGRVTVDAGEKGESVWVSVADTGVGIASEELPYIFQQFYRGGESRPPEKRGMGLGLAICREIIAAHQGQIRVESANGEGARFTFTLPKA
jgi:signal transduction histidine kinase